MVARSLAPKWSPLGIWQRLRKTIRQPSDILLLLRLGYFIWRMPTALELMHLTRLLDGYRAAHRPKAVNVTMGYKRLIRLSTPWLRLSRFKAYNTCYFRALLLYRFLDPAGSVMRIHFVVESRPNTATRLHGHAWVTAGGEVLDDLDPTIIENARELYSHPPHAEAKTAQPFR